MAIKTIIVTTGRNEMVERILLRTTQETFLRKNEGLRGGRIMALKEEKIMALKEEKIMALKEEKIMALKEGKIMALRGETVGLLIKEIIEYLIKGMMALLIGEIESLAIATLEIMAVGTCMTIAITIVETFASIITKNQSIVVIIDPTIVTIDSMTAPSADCTVFSTNMPLFGTLCGSIHPNRIQHIHASLVILDPCQKSDLLRRFQNIHIAIHHLLHCLHIIIDLSHTPYSILLLSATRSTAIKFPEDYVAACESALSRLEWIAAALQ